jgi:hypothetical protein
MPRVLRYNLAVLQQAIDVIDWCDEHGRQACFADAVGPHLRHVLEHYEELLDGLDRRVLEYDRRRRDRRVEADTSFARARFVAVIDSLERFLNEPPVSDELAVMLCGGVAGEEQFVSRSSLARELLFVASHAIHHYAILKPALIERGYAAAADFGKAPATIHYERELAV